MATVNIQANIGNSQFAGINPANIKTGAQSSPTFAANKIGAKGNQKSNAAPTPIQLNPVGNSGRTANNGTVPMSHQTPNVAVKSNRGLSISNSYPIGKNFGASHKLSGIGKNRSSFT
jgi:long-subunit fatty acid transport protein